MIKKETLFEIGFTVSERDEYEIKIFAHTFTLTHAGYAWEFYRLHKGERIIIGTFRKLRNLSEFIRILKIDHS